VQEKTKTQADRQEIKRIFSIEPVDWARYPDGTLSFISPTGQKFKYSQDMLDILSEDIKTSIPAKRAAAKKTSAKKAATKKSKSNLSRVADLNAEINAAVSYKGTPGAAAK